MSIANTHFGADKIKEMLKDAKSVFFVGIGGINMSSLAHVTMSGGVKVGGSDKVCSELTRRLESEGAEIFYEHNTDNIYGYDALVYTVAISEDNPEYSRALDLGLPCISRADYMGYLMMSYARRIGVSGMHGKSTCTSMCATTFINADTDPTVLSGAELSSMNGAYRVSRNSKEYMIFEACEYMDSFLDFNPNIAVVLNIEMDHVDYFKSMEQIKRSYTKYALGVGENGCIIANADDENVRDALGSAEQRVLYFGVNNATADVKAENIADRHGHFEFDLTTYGTKVCRIKLNVFGYHNVYNALACAAVALECGLTADQIKSGLESFRGAARRMEYKGRLNGARVYDDYAHHPTEISATLDGARKTLDENGRLWCVFQSHTYSRTYALLDEFAQALSKADVVVVCDIYAAREDNIYGVTPEILAKQVVNGAVACHGFESAANMLKDGLRPGDVAIVMGAGDVWHVFDYIKFE